MNGAQAKLIATIKPPKDNHPISASPISSVLNHLVRPAPVTKYGNEAEIPKKMKFIGVFLSTSIIFL